MVYTGAMDRDILDEAKQRLQKVLDVLKTDLGTIRTGRAAPSLVENVVVKVYGGTTVMKIVELATVGTTDPQTIVITPYDQSIIHEIAKGIQDANVGMNPVVDSTLIRISLPPLSQERREELAKLMKHKLENGRIMARQVRHEIMEQIKKQHDEKTISDDDKMRLEKDLQRFIDETSQTIENLGKQKESELMAM